jgi:hypothetical protein
LYTAIENRAQVKIGNLKSFSTEPFEPLSTNQQPSENKRLTENSNPVLSTGLDKILQKYPELERIITAWPELAEQDRKAMLDIVKGQ